MTEQLVLTYCIFSRKIVDCFINSTFNYNIPYYDHCLLVHLSETNDLLIIIPLMMLSTQMENRQKQSE